MALCSIQLGCKLMHKYRLGNIYVLQSCQLLFENEEYNHYVQVLFCYFCLTNVCARGGGNS